MHRHLLANLTLASWQRWEHFHKETAFYSQHNTQKLHTIAIVQYIWVHYSGQLFSGAESGHWCVVSHGWYRRLIWYPAAWVWPDDSLLPGQLATLPSISGYWQQATLLTVSLTKLLVVSLLWYRHCSVYLNFSMSTLHKPSQRNSRKPETKQQQPTSHLLYSFPETITKKRWSSCAYTAVCIHICLYM